MTFPQLHRYRVHGFVLESEIELPELAERRVAAEAPVDVRIRLGSVTRPADASHSELKFVPVPGGVVLDIAGVARYLAEGGKAITIEPCSAAEPELMRVFLLGSVIAMVCLQQDCLVLHASAVAFDDRAVAFVGDQGAGKSTLAAYCVKAGARLVADDLLRISIPEQGPPGAYPGMPLLKLWRNALDGLGRSSAGLVRDYWRMDKFLVPFGDPAAETTLPLRCIYVLEADQDVKEELFDRLTGATAVTAIVANSHGLSSIDAVGKRFDHFRDCVHVARSVEVLRLKRRRDLAQLPRTAALIARTFGRHE